MPNEMINIFRREETSISYKQIIDLIHESFKERLAQGLKYTCSFMSEEDYIKNTQGGGVYVAIDTSNNILAGTVTIKMHTDGKSQYGYMEYLSIKNEYKHKGVGSLLLEHISETELIGCDYILSDTSTEADSAIRFHLKHGFNIIGLESYRSTNYWSYVFRKQLAPSKLWHNSIFMKIHYGISYILIKTTRDIDGNDTIIGNCCKIIRKACRNLLLKNSKM